MFYQAPNGVNRTFRLLYISAGVQLLFWQVFPTIITWHNGRFNTSSMFLGAIWQVWPMSVTVQRKGKNDDDST